MLRGALPLVALGLAAGCAPSWQTVGADLPDEVLSIDGDGRDSLYLAGGGLGDGRPGMLQRFQRGAWQRLDTGSTDTLWWVGRAGTARFAVGENGTLLSVDGEQVTRQSVPTTATLFGVWGAAETDAWAVGGSPQGGPVNDVVLHFDGAQWTSVDLPQKRSVALLKVWGTAADDVWLCGQLGTLWRWNGAAFEAQHLPTRANIVTVAGRARDDVWAVGGPPLALFHFDGTAWTSVEGPSLASALSGVAFGAGGEGVAVGSTGTRWHLARGASAWTEAPDDALSGDLHAVYVLDDGRAVAGGGNYLALSSPDTPRKGVLATYGFSLPKPAP